MYELKFSIFKIERSKQSEKYLKVIFFSIIKSKRKKAGNNLFSAFLAGNFSSSSKQKKNGKN